MDTHALAWYGKDFEIAFLKEKGRISTQDFKSLTNASRKYTIPLAEYFDAIKVTVRVGDDRILRGEGKE